MSYNILRATMLAGIVALAGAVVAQDELSKGDREWMEKEVGPIITEHEKATFQEIHEDDRKLFKELFWMRRDYNPTTSENEFEEEYQERVDLANDTFKQRGRKGSETDMGQLFILLGAPDARQQGRGADPTVPAPGRGAEPAAPAPGESPGMDPPGQGIPDLGGGDSAAQEIIWVYEPRPELGLPEGLTARFRNQSDFGYRLTNRDAIAEDLERAKLRLIANPGVTYARDDEGRLREPDDRYDPNSPAKKILNTLQETGETSDAIAFETEPMFFRSSASQVYIPIDMVVTGDWEGGDATVFGAVENADGFTIYQFEEQADIDQDEEGRPTFEMPLQLQPGLYTLHIGILDDDGTTYGTKTMDLEVPDFETGGLKLSSILLFSEGEQVGEAMGSPGRAFLLAGYHFIPKRDMTYTSSDQLSGVFNVYNFGVEGGKPNLTVQLAFSKDGESRGQTAEDPFMLQAEEMALTIFDVPLNVKNFEEPGTYRVEIKVNDKVKNETLTETIEFEKVDS